MSHNFKNKLHYFISEQIPDFINAEYPVFVTFLEKYYEFLETDNQVHNLLLNSSSWNDIDETLTIFIDYFKSQYAPDISGDALVQSRRLIKYIFEYYEGKGSENSVELFFRFMYNEKATVAYPGDYILRASDGKWSRKRIVKLDNTTPLEYTPSHSNPYDLISKKIKFVYLQTIPGQGRTLKSIETSCFNVVKTVVPRIYELEIDLSASYEFPEIISPIVGQDINGDNIPETIPTLGDYDTHIYVVYNNEIYGSLTKQIVDVISIDTIGSNFRIDDAYKISEGGVEGFYFASDYVYDTTDGVSEISVIDGGELYSNDAQIVITGDGFEAAAQPVIVDGVITDVNILSIGFSYSSATATVEDDTGIGAELSVTVNEGVYKPYTVNAYVNNGIIRVKEVTSFNAETPTGILELQIVNTGQRFTARELSAIGDASYFREELDPETLLLTAYVDGSSDTTIYVEGDCDLYGGDVVEYRPVDRFTVALSPRYPRNLSGQSAEITFRTGIIYHAAGSYKDASGFLSDINKLQDNYYYQPYSYVIQSQKTFSTWKDAYLRTNHPAGFRAFAEVQFIDTININSNILEKFSLIFLPIVDVVTVTDIVQKNIEIVLGIPYFAHIDTESSVVTSYYTDFIDSGQKYVEDDFAYPIDELNFVEPGESFLILEDASGNILLENSDNILLEG